MHVAIIDGDVSYPANSGKRLRTLNLMLQVAKRHRITYVGRCDASSEEAQIAPQFFRDHGIEPIIVHDPVPCKSGFAFLARLLANQFSTEPYSVASHYSEPMRRAVDALARENPVDLWQVEWPPYQKHIDPALPGPRIAIAHNVDTLIWERYYRTEKQFLKKAFLKSQWQRFRRYEAKAFHQASRVVAVSEEDGRLIRQFGQAKVDVVDNGIDRSFYEKQTHGPRDPSRILFLGSLEWRPNIDALDLLLDEIFPKVLQQEPGAKLSIVGRNPSAALSARVEKTAGVELYGNVADVRPYLGESGVMAVPLRIGGGSRLKILESLASGLPVVSSKIGAEGLLLKPEVDYVQADGVLMADALVRAIRNPVEMQKMAAHGQQVVFNRYDWESLAKKLEASWEKSLQPGNESSSVSPSASLAQATH